MKRRCVQRDAIIFHGCQRLQAVHVVRHGHIAVAFRREQIVPRGARVFARGNISSSVWRQASFRLVLKFVNDSIVRIQWGSSSDKPDFHGRRIPPDRRSRMAGLRDGSRPLRQFAIRNDSGVQAYSVPEDRGHRRYVGTASPVTVFHFGCVSIPSMPWLSKKRIKVRAGKSGIVATGIDQTAEAIGYR